MIKWASLIAIIGVLIYYGAGKLSAPNSPDTAISQAKGDIIINVLATDSNIYGRPWDGIRMGGVAGRMMPDLPTHSPPDMALCLIDPGQKESNMECYHKGDAEAPISICHDSFECSFSISIPQGRSFGILIYDIDGLIGSDRHDLIDAFIVDNGDRRTSEAERLTREAMSLIARTDVDIPPWLRNWVGQSLGNRLPEWLKKLADRKSIDLQPSETLRRDTQFKIYKPGDCDSGCRLSQSFVTINWTSFVKKK
jgi:hypothetical protein